MAATNSSPNAGNYYSGTGIIKIKLNGETVWRDIGNCPVFEIGATVERFTHKSNRVATRYVDFSHITSRSVQLTIGLEEMSADNMALLSFGEVIEDIDLDVTATITGTALTLITPTTGLVVGERYRITGANYGNNNYLTYGPAAGAGTLRMAGTDGAAAAGNISRPMQIDGMVATEKRGKLRFVSTNDIGPRVQFDFEDVSFSPAETMALLQEELANPSITGEANGNAQGRFWRELWNIDAEYDDDYV